MLIALVAVAAFALPGSAAAATQTPTSSEATALVVRTTLDPETPAETKARVRHEAKVRAHNRLVRRKPFVYPDGRRWAVPYPIAWCESGGDYFVGPSGAYGLIPPFPQYMSPREQDRVALDLYRRMGESPWAPYEGGCAYR
jgi:hypothetical protein